MRTAPAPTHVQLERGVICSSAGNHAQGVALAARQLVRSAAPCLAPCSDPPWSSSGVDALTAGPATRFRWHCCRHACRRRPADGCLPRALAAPPTAALDAVPARLPGAASEVPTWPILPRRLCPQGCSAVICMPTTTPDIKVKAVRALGGTVELVGESYQEAQAHAQASTGACSRARRAGGRGKGRRRRWAEQVRPGWRCRIWRVPAGMSE